MSTKFNVATLEAARNTPNAQKFLNFLSQAEGTAK